MSTTHSNRDCNTTTPRPTRTILLSGLATAESGDGSAQTTVLFNNIPVTSTTTSTDRNDNSDSSTYTSGQYSDITSNAIIDSNKDVGKFYKFTPTTNASTTSSTYPCRLQHGPACLAMKTPTKRIIRKGCISTAFMCLLFIIHLHKDLEPGNTSIENKPFVPTQTDEVIRQALSAARTGTCPNSAAPPMDQYRHLPPPFKVTHVGSWYDIKPDGILANKTHHPFNCTASKLDPSFKICVYETAIDRFISGALLSSGIWEPYITSAFQHALSRHADATVIDIGANIGYYSLLASSRGHSVIAVEPYEQNQRRLAVGSVLTRHQHSGSGRVVLLGNAMSDGHKFVSLSRSENNQGGLRVLEECQSRRLGMFGFLGELYGQNNEREERKLNGPHVGPTVRRCDIPTLTMDDLLLVINTSTAIIKVDIEGYECRAMGQTTKFLKSIEVPYIFMEWRLMREQQRDFDTACPTHQIRQLSSTLFDLGYIPHEVQSGIRLNPYNAHEWQVGDVYWRKTKYSFLVPSM